MSIRSESLTRNIKCGRVSSSCLSGHRASPGILNVGELIMSIRCESLTRNIKCGELILSIRSESLTRDIKCGRVHHVYQV